MISYYENKICTVSNLSSSNNIPFNTAKRKINSLLNSKLIYNIKRIKGGKHNIFLPTPSLVNIFEKYLDNITFIKPLSDDNRVYKIKYNGKIAILRIIYSKYNYTRELNVALKRDKISECNVSLIETEESFDESTVVSGGLIIYNYIPGIDLWKFLVDKNSKLSESLVKRIMRSILIPLKQLHDNNIIHGDIKLENILMDT